ncbi:MAG: T9SS type A sorting domain-containing protein, partial [Bacteroidetes bacterium]|nr:T9SS type A sorting domain-containing protein [Bacteroidota bacterium]
PGQGNGTSISITPGVNLSNQTVAINTAGLTNGVHRVYLRTKSGEGNWSLTNVKDFTVSLDPAYPTAPIAPQNIIAAEYFIDTDPGQGNGTSISITPGVNLSNQTVAINTTGLVVGIHRVYLRTKSGEGNWSITNVKDFTVSLDQAYPTAPVAPQNIIAAEYFIDTDPGQGNGTSISITPGVNLSNQTVAINTNSLVVGIHRVYLRTKSGEGNWSLTNVDSFHVTNPLSLNLLSFSGVGKGDDVLLNWSTINESQASFFEVEYSLDAAHFEPIGKVLAHNSSETQHYNYLHTHVPQAILYYRLKQVDKNESFTFSNTISINKLQRTDLEVWLYPNPTEKTITVQNLKKEDIVSLKIIATDGKTIQILTARNDMQYDVSALSAGVYFLELLKKDGEKSQISFVKR